MNSSTSLSSFPPSYVEEDIGPDTVATAIAFIVIEIIIVGLRLVVRRHKFGVDDILIFPALVFCLGVCSIAIVEVKIADVGRHLPIAMILNPMALVNWAKCGYAIEQLYCASVVFPKLSILTMYLRIFQEKFYRAITYVVGVVIVLTAIAGILVSFFSCHRFKDRLEDPGNTRGQCMDYIPFWRWIGFPNIVTDVIILVLPVPTVKSLHLPRREKLGLFFVFLTGSIGLIASLIRFAMFFDVNALSDGTFVSAKLAQWTIIEPGFYLVASCLPTLRPLMRDVVQGSLKFLSSKTIATQSIRLEQGRNTSTSSDKHIILEG